MTPDGYIKQQLGEMSVTIAVLRAEIDTLKEEKEARERERDPARNSS